MLRRDGNIFKPAPRYANVLDAERRREESTLRALSEAASDNMIGQAWDTRVAMGEKKTVMNKIRQFRRFFEALESLCSTMEEVR